MSRPISAGRRPRHERRPGPGSDLERSFDLIPRVSYLDLVVPTDIQTRERQDYVDGNVSAFEIDVINRLVKSNNPKTLFEIGTFDGRTTLNMAAHSAPDAHIYTLDLPPSGIDTTALKIDHGDRLFIDKPSSGARFIGSDVLHKITQLYGDSATFDFQAYFGKVDFLFVDGSHSRDYVIQDSMTALKLVRENGIILWHDYAPEGPTPWPGLTAAINELHAGDPRFSDMIYIAGTAIVILRMPGYAGERAAVVPESDGVFGDSSQPEYLLASLRVDIDKPVVKTGRPLRFRAQATNTGRTIWLPSVAPVGPVRLGSRLLDENGTWLDGSYSRHHLPGGRSISPGESVAFKGQVPCPPIGRYNLEFDLVADGVAWFHRNGATSVRVPVEVNSRGLVRPLERWHTVLRSFRR